jgi:hypothetical protein
LKIEDFGLQIEKQTRFLLRRAVCLVLSVFSFDYLLFSFPAAVLLLSDLAVEGPDLLTPRFDLHTADGMVASGRLVQVREDWSVSLSGKKALEVDGGRVIALRQSKTVLPPPPREQHVVLTNGDQIPGTPVQLSGERVGLKTHLGTETQLTLPLSAITLFWFAAPDGIEDSDRFRQRLASERRKRDTVLLRNGDMIEGTVTELDSTTVQMDAAKGKATKVAREKIAVLALSTELARPLRAKGVYGRLVLANGSRLSLQSARVDGQALVGKALFGATVQVPVNQIVALDLHQGCAIYLSDLKPQQYIHTPYLGVHWPFTFDVSVAGNQIRVAGSSYDKGIGMHSQSRLTFDLGGKYRWFEALVGLDDRTGREGTALIQVLVDGKPGAFGEAKEIAGPAQTVPVRVQVAGGRELTLVVLFGRRGDVQGHIDWADARLIK